MEPCLFLVRHAQSANNAQDERYRIPDPSITKLGHAQSERLAEALADLRLTILVTSPFLRSIETTRWAAARTGLVPRIHRDIFEQGGCYRGYAPGERMPEKGMGRSELQSLCPGWHIDPSIAETGWNQLDRYEGRAEAFARARGVVRWFESTDWCQQDRVAMVIHADFKMRLLEAMLDREDLESHLGEVVNTSITRLSRSGSGWKLDFWNSHQHLSPDMITT
jgi:2,3-bisphosphoglycerate-dependent phosphoglycerate mutase